jgi:hypothetical protein
MPNKTKVIDGHKQCTCCKQVKAVSEFYGRGDGRPWLQAECKQCKLEKQQMQRRAIMSDPQQYWTYRVKNAEDRRRWKNRRIAKEGRNPVYVPMQERIDAIMKLI